MGLVKSLQKHVKSQHVLSFIGFFVVLFAIIHYSKQKKNKNESYDNPYLIQSGQNVPGMNNPSTFQASPGPSSLEQTIGLPPVNSSSGVFNPSELLPKDVNQQWAQLNPSGNSDFNNVNLLKAGYLNGIDTVGSTMRNANLQVRSEPPNPTSQVSPWSQSTIEPDKFRPELDIGTHVKSGQ